MQWPWFIGLFVGNLICCLMPGLLLYFLGYQARVIENKDLVETTCKIIDHKVYPRTCEESCNCITTCISYSSNGCTSYTTTCQTCYYTCYDGYLIVNYTIQKTNYTNDMCAYSGYESSHDVVSDMNSNYPIGTSVACYYDPRDVNTVQLTYYPTTVYLVFACIFFALTVIIPIIGVILILRFA